MKKNKYQVDINKLVQELNKIKCPIHNEFVTAELMDGKISTKVCCEDIRDEIIKVINKCVEGDVDGAILHLFKKS